MKALIVNRIGDLGLSLGIFTIFFVFGNLDYSTVFALSNDFINNQLTFFSFNFNVLTIICFFILIGAVGKSSQIGLHT
jgi:NADH-quinone oxidoreductase subunit L